LRLSFATTAVVGLVAAGALAALSWNDVAEFSGGSRGAVTCIAIVVAAMAGSIALFGLHTTRALKRLEAELCAARTEQERTHSDWQDRFQAILDHSPSAIFLKDLDGRFTFVNKELARRCRVTIEGAIGKTDFDFLDPATAERLRESDRKIIRTGRAEEREITLNTPEGPRTIMSLRFPVFDRDGQIVRIGGIGTDITERQLAVASAKRLQSELAHVLRIGTVGEMATGLAHELNQPLTAIRNYTTGLALRLDSDRTTPEEAARVLGLIGDQALRAGNIVRGIRNLVQRREGEFRATDINTAIQEVAELLANEAIAKDIGVHLDLAADLPAVPADEVQIQQVVLNLARNAMDAMADKQPDRNARHLTLRSTRQDRDVLIAVEDTGPGIPQGVGQHVFEPFFTTRGAGAGMGMGLPICRTIVEAHSGRLWFTTETGAGTVFYVSLPAAPPHHLPH